MAKLYGLRFGTGDSSVFTGLSPSFTIFSWAGTTTITPSPGITETPAGSGLYSFQYEPTLPIIFKVDGGSGLSSTDRYIYGILDPIQAVDEKIGYITDSYGSTAVDPTTVFGYLKRNQEFEEGNATFIKQTGIWDIYSRGSSTLLTEKTLSDNTTQSTKT